MFARERETFEKKNTKNRFTSDYFPEMICAPHTREHKLLS